MSEPRPFPLVNFQPKIGQILNGLKLVFSRSVGADFFPVFNQPLTEQFTTDREYVVTHSHPRLDNIGDLAESYTVLPTCANDVENHWLQFAVQRPQTFGVDLVRVLGLLLGSGGASESFHRGFGERFDANWN